ncbi:pre-mRNA processing RNA-helicase [Coemansia sp. IMI 203386]|nr:pre-mRNA processing RNA-helicase [Coemansia sp. IMI 203386]
MSSSRHGVSRHSSKRQGSRSPDSTNHRSSVKRSRSRSRSPESTRRRIDGHAATSTSTRPGSALGSATEDADGLKKLSMKERLAMWKKRKEQSKASPADQLPSADSANKTDCVERPESRASLSGADESNSSSMQFVTAPSSAISRSNTSSEKGFGSLPSTPVSGMVESTSESRPAPGLKQAFTLSRNTKARSLLLNKSLSKPGFGSLRLKKPSPLGNSSVFGTDTDDTGSEILSRISFRSFASATQDNEPELQRDGAADTKEESGSASDNISAASHKDQAEVDSLELFMNTFMEKSEGNESPSSQTRGEAETEGALSNGKKTGSNSDTRLLIDDEGDDDEKQANDADDLLALAAKRLKKKDLAPVDHSRMNYESFKKEFYIEPAELRSMTPEEVDMARVDLGGIKVRGVDPPKPATNWSYFGLPAACADVIRHQGFEKPTPIQAQAVPAILSGRDIIGVAKTGSGKTLAFILPMLRHIKAQRPLAQSEGPVGLVMTPTRELAVQIHRECKPFLKPLGLRAVCAYGGSGIKDQIGELKRGAEIIVCTPGRLIDLLCANSGRVTNLHRVTYLVLDEADRMFDMGFEPQVSKIVQGVRPSRQTVLFSATFPRQMEALARKILRRPLEIVVGGRALIPPEVAQHVEVVESSERFVRLLGILGDTFNQNPETLALIFVDRQEAADSLLRDLMRRGYVCNSLHGGKDQTDRDQAIADFKNRVYSVLIATSVAARGLDVRGLNVVINYDCPNHMEDLVHRVGRTGRAGNKGDAYTFIMPGQDRYASEVAKAMKLSGLVPPADVQAMADAFMDKVRQGKERHGKSGFGGKGLEKLDKDRDMVKKIQKVTYGAASGEALDEDDDDDNQDGGGRGDVDSDGEPGVSSARRERAKEKDNEVVRRLPATPRSASVAAASPLATDSTPNSPAAHPQALSAKQAELSPKPLSAAAQAAQLAAQAVVQRLNIDSKAAATGVSGAPVLSAVDQINQQLGISAAASRHGEALASPSSRSFSAKASAGAAANSHTDASTSAGAGTAKSNAPSSSAHAHKMRSGQFAHKDGSGTKDLSTGSVDAGNSGAAASGASSAIPVGAYGCELDINDYPKKARWRATNRETLSQIIDQTGAAITMRGIFVPPGKPVPDGERKLYLTIESDSERSVEQAKSEIKRILTEATVQVMEQEARGGAATGRYSVV